MRALCYVCFTETMYCDNVQVLYYLFAVGQYTLRLVRGEVSGYNIKVGSPLILSLFQFAWLEYASIARCHQ